MDVCVVNYVWIATGLSYLVMSATPISELLCYTFGFITVDKHGIMLTVIDIALIILAIFLADTAIMTILKTRKGVSAESKGH